MNINLDKLSQTNILVIGDVMLDRYAWGRVKRISPEAPVPVVLVQEKTEVLGGAGNVAANLKGLGSSVCLLGVCGADETGKCLKIMLDKKEIEHHLLIDPSRPTITKTRVMAQGQQLFRLDEEDVQLFSSELQEEMLAVFKEKLLWCQAVIVSDYGKGLSQTPNMCQTIIQLCRGHNIPVLIDPKGNDWERYKGATSVTPNRAELELIAGEPVDGDEEKLFALAKTVRARFSLDSLLVTLGAKGMCLEGPESPAFLIPAKAREVYDVSGAGDTVIATLAVGLAAGLPFPAAVELANVAAGIVVGKLGTQPITFAELKAGLRINNLNGHGDTPAKLAPLESAALQMQAWRTDQKRIVFTNGCFDLLHPGHVHLLNEAKALGDKLVVGLNSDASIKKLKGTNRPILQEQERASLVSALSSVDLVVIFEEDTPLDLIEALRPDILVKGSDYSLDTVVGREVVESYGGKVALIALMEGLSTTGLISRIGK